MFQAIIIIIIMVSIINITGWLMVQLVSSNRSVIKLVYIYGQMCCKCMGKLNAHIIWSNMQQIYGQTSISVPVGSYLIIIGILLICVTVTCEYFPFPMHTNVILPKLMSSDPPSRLIVGTKI